MPANPRRIYFDANVFLAYVGNEQGRADTVQALLDESRRDEIEIVTSVLSIAEVAYGAHERDLGLTEAGEEAIEQLWTPASPVILVDVSQAVTRNARTMIREAKTLGLSGFRGADAIHLATAQHLGTDLGRVVTYDERMLHAAKQLRIRTAAPR